MEGRKTSSLSSVAARLSVLFPSPSDEHYAIMGFSPVKEGCELPSTPRSFEHPCVYQQNLEDYGSESISFFNAQSIWSF